MRASAVVTEHGGCDVGAVQTMMSVDADRVVNLCMSLHDLWSLPVQIGIALWLLYTQVHICTPCSAYKTNAIAVQNNA